MPKMHYTPFRKRFIIASSMCSTKPLSSIISKAFKHIFHQIRNFHLKSLFYKNYHLFWVIENSFPIIEKLDSINKTRSAKNISTYDFSTLYTKLTHTDLIRVLHELIDFVFDASKFRSSKKKRFLTITDHGTYWSNTASNNSFNKKSIKDLVSHLIGNCFFSLETMYFCKR